MAEEAEAVHEPSDLVGVGPSAAAVARLAAGARAEVGGSPTADPAVALVHEPHPLQVDVPLGVVDLDARPGSAAIGRLQDGGALEALEGDEAQPAAEELDLPAPLPQRQLIRHTGQPVDPGLSAVVGLQDHRPHVGAGGVRLLGPAPDHEPVAVAGEPGVDEEGGVAPHVPGRPRGPAVDGLHHAGGPVRVVGPCGVDDRLVHDRQAADGRGRKRGQACHHLPARTAIARGEEAPGRAERPRPTAAVRGETDAPEVHLRIVELLLPGAPPVFGAEDLAVAVHGPPELGRAEPDVVGARARFRGIGGPPRQRGRGSIAVGAPVVDPALEEGDVRLGDGGEAGGHAAELAVGRRLGEVGAEGCASP